jgi:GT2 family glycosyltransferase
MINSREDLVADDPMMSAKPHDSKLLQQISGSAEPGGTPSVGGNSRLIIIPFYRSAFLVKQVFDSLVTCASELTKLSFGVVAINDSPDDPRLAEELARHSARLKPTTMIEVISPPVNMGFIGATNLGLSRAVESGSDAMLLNSDTIIFPGALTEMCEVAELDPMIGFVSPRSNNATICSIPRGQEFAGADPETAFQTFRTVARFLPRFQFVPTAVGFCLLIRNTIIADLGKLDTAYGFGYDEENDLIMRANRVGFRAVIANKAFVYHQGEVSFTQTDRSKSVVTSANSARLNERYPEFTYHIREYNRSTRSRAEDLLTAALPARDGTHDLLFDCNHFGPYHNGTFEVGRKLLRNLAAEASDKFTVYVQSSLEAAAFHKLRNIPGVLFLPQNVSRTFAVGIRVGQPFEPSHLFRIGNSCLSCIHVMQDSIAWDCLYLNTDNLEELWRSVFEAPNGVVYISDFTRDQFSRRFRKHPRLRELVNYHSMASGEYRPGKPVYPGKKYILVVGNSFAHKFVNSTLEKLVTAFPNDRFVALGVDSTPYRSVLAYPSGDLTNKAVHGLYANASLVIYPSFYEGFGLPLLTSLAHGKPIVARDLPVARAIREGCGEGQNLHLYRTTDELVSLLRGARPLWQTSAAGAASWNWANAARKLALFARELFEQTTVDDDIIPRLESLDRLERSLSRRKAELHFTAPPADRSLETTVLQDISPETDRTHEVLQRRIEDLENSLSWRITGPLRTLARPFLERRSKS